MNALRFLSVLLTCLSLSAIAGASTTATLLKDDVLRAKPFLDGKAVLTLKRGATVNVLKRQGAWTQVKDKTTSGWVRSLSLKSGSATLATSRLTSVNSGRLGSGTIVSTTGIRGLEQGGEQQLKDAKFSAEALAQARAAAVDEDSARRFAAQGKLKSRPVAWLQENK